MWVSRKLPRISGVGGRQLHRSVGAWLYLTVVAATFIVGLVGNASLPEGEPSFAWVWSVDAVLPWSVILPEPWWLSTFGALTNTVIIAVVEMALRSRQEGASRRA